MWGCEFVALHGCALERNKERRNGSKRQSKTPVKQELGKSHQARSEFTEQHAHYKLCCCLKVFVCSG